MALSQKFRKEDRKNRISLFSTILPVFIVRNCKVNLFIIIKPTLAFNQNPHSIQPVVGLQSTNIYYKKVVLSRRLGALKIFMTP